MIYLYNFFKGNLFTAIDTTIIPLDYRGKFNGKYGESDKFLALEKTDNGSHVYRLFENGRFTEKTFSASLINITNSSEPKKIKFELKNKQQASNGLSREDLDSANKYLKKYVFNEQVTSLSNGSKKPVKCSFGSADLEDASTPNNRTLLSETQQKENLPANSISSNTTVASETTIISSEDSLNGEHAAQADPISSKRIEVLTQKPEPVVQQPATRTTESSLEPIEKVLLSNLPSKSIRERDVIIINPCTDGGGDQALGEKIANIALDQGCRVIISPLDVSRKNTNECNQKYQSYSFRNEEPHNISQFSNPLFIIAPVGLPPRECLETHIKDMCEKFKFTPKDAILIEEMDMLDKDNSLNKQQSMLKNIGFTEVTGNRLGFSEGAIGYIPTDEKTINEIKNRFEGELIKLLDSYNMSLSRDSSYHLGYISSPYYVTATKVFIANTLCETIRDKRSANFIMSLRTFRPDIDDKSDSLIDEITKILKFDNNYDYLSLFSKATIIVIDSDSGDVKTRKELKGNGTKEVKIILTNKLPKNIYDDFMLLADTGMATGDQSLSEYLTLKKTLPYYDTQIWKYNLMKSIQKLGGGELKKYLEGKFVLETTPMKRIFSLYSPAETTLNPEQSIKKKELDKIISSNIATPLISEQIRSKMHPKK